MKKKEENPPEKKEPEEKTKPLEENEIKILTRQALGPFAPRSKKLEEENKELIEKINKTTGIKESDTGLSLPTAWDLEGDKRLLEEQPLQVARCTKIIKKPEDQKAKYMITLKQIAKFVVGLGQKVAPTDIEEGMRVGVIPHKYSIEVALPAKIDASVTMMTVEEKPDVTYEDIGGCKEQIDRLREVVEYPLLDPDRFIRLGIDPPKGVLLYGSPGTGKTLTARAVANRTDACFIRCIGSELVQKYGRLFVEFKLSLDGLKDEQSGKGPGW